MLTVPCHAATLASTPTASPGRQDGGMADSNRELQRASTPHNATLVRVAFKEPARPDHYAGD